VGVTMSRFLRGWRRALAFLTVVRDLSRKRNPFVVVSMFGMAAITLMGLSACGSNTSGQSQDTTTQEQTTAASATDWDEVGQAIGKDGKLMKGDVYRVDLPRTDLQVTSQGVDIKPALSLGSYTAFKDMGDGNAMVMGDLVLTEDEYNKVIDRLQEAGIGQTGVHKHLLEESPAIWWTHIQGTGDPVDMAKTINSALKLTGTPLKDSGSSESEDLGFDTSQLDETIGHTGTTQGGVYKYSIGRADSVTENGMELPPAMGVSTAFNFQPTGGGKAAINGDFAMTQDEVQPVIKALRDNDIQVVSLHNHMLNEEPRIFFMHFWANDDAQKLAQGLRAALDKTNSAKE
jgi:hypothetical protein